MVIINFNVLVCEVECVFLCIYYACMRIKYVCNSVCMCGSACIPRMCGSASILHYIGDK